MSIHEKWLKQLWPSQAMECHIAIEKTPRVRVMWNDMHSELPGPVNTARCGMTCTACCAWGNRNVYPHTLVPA